ERTRGHVPDRLGCGTGVAGRTAAPVGAARTLRTPRLRGCPGYPRGRPGLRSARGVRGARVLRVPLARRPTTCRTRRGIPAATRDRGPVHEGSRCRGDAERVHAG